MELTRRDALRALAATGAVAGTASAYRWGRGDGDPAGFTDHERETLVALARVVFPGAVSGVPAFVETYTVGRVEDRPGYASGMREAVATLDDYATDWFDDRFVDLSPATRDELLRQMSLDTRDADPEGDPVERVRYYLVDELLYALYTSPTGGKLVGLENPPGHPGGRTSYRLGPADGG